MNSWRLGIAKICKCYNNISLLLIFMLVLGKPFPASSFCVSVNKIRMETCKFLEREINKIKITAEIVIFLFYLPKNIYIF